MARYTLKRYWVWDSQPNVPSIETTLYEDDVVGNPNGTVLSVASPFPQAGATLLADEAAYDAAIQAGRAPTDPAETARQNAAATLAAYKTDCEAAYDDLVANGILPATATLLTGHTP